jgi:hypothetical protein
MVRKREDASVRSGRLPENLRPLPRHTQAGIARYFIHSFHRNGRTASIYLGDVNELSKGRCTLQLESWLLETGQPGILRCYKSAWGARPHGNDFEILRCHEREFTARAIVLRPQIFELLTKETTIVFRQRCEGVWLGGALPLLRQ